MNTTPLSIALLFLEKSNSFAYGKNVWNETRMILDFLEPIDRTESPEKNHPRLYSYFYLEFIAEYLGISLNTVLSEYENCLKIKEMKEYHG